MEKIIHYFYEDFNVWEKGNAPVFRICYASWLKYCPDYEFKLWHINMPEFQEILSKNEFLQVCLKYKLWAFIADYVRHYACYHYGGIYLDTDVQLVGNFDKFLDKGFFVSIEGDSIDGKNIPETAVMGAQKGHPLLKKMLDYYNSGEIFKSDYLIDPIVFGEMLEKEIGFKNINYSTADLAQKAGKLYMSSKHSKLTDYELYRNQKPVNDTENNITIYPSEYFCPTWPVFGNDAFTDKTVAIHWNQSSWWGLKPKLRFLQSYRYKNPVKRFFYANLGRIVKLFTFFIPMKEVRKKIRHSLIQEI